MIVPIAMLLILALAVTSCELVPGTHTSSVSPDGRSTAYVRQGLSIDPPEDHLFLKTGDAAAKELMVLGPDMDWSRAIAWSPDSRTVGFVVNEQQLAFFDVATGEHLAMLDLIGGGGQSSPGAVRAVSIDNDRRSVSFERYERPLVLRTRHDGTTYEYPVAKPESSERVVKEGRIVEKQQVAVPEKRLKVRIAGSGGFGDRGWFRMKAMDGRATVFIPIQWRAGQVIELPAFDDGPLSSLEISANGPRAIAKNVPVTGDTLDMQLFLEH
jgi:hypothetical protein